MRRSAAAAAQWGRYRGARAPCQADRLRISCESGVLSSYETPL